MTNKKNKNLKYPPPRTMSEFIYNNLKEDIMNNEIKANQRINEKEIAEAFHVSRTPVREAVLRLAAEGFVQIDSYRRAIVKEVTFEELSEIIQVLGALDRLAMELAIENLTTKEIKKLEEITKKMEKYCKPIPVSLPAADGADDHQGYPLFGSMVFSSIHLQFCIFCR